MSEKSKRSRKNRGAKRRSRNKNKQPGSQTSGEVIETVSSEDNTTNEIILETKDYVVEVPQQAKKLSINSKSKSLDDDTVFNIVEIDVKFDSEKVPVESNAIITEAESDIEWETTNNLDNNKNIDIIDEQPPPQQPQQTQRISPQKEIDLRNFLQTLNLQSQPNIELKPKSEPKESEIDIKIKKAQMRAALEQHCQAQMLRPRFLDIIDEEGSNDSGDNTKSDSNRNSFKFIDDLEDDVFMVDKKVKEPKEYFPKPRDYLAHKKELRRLQECRLVDTKIVENECEEGCGDWTLEKTEQQGGAEIVFLEDSSSSTSENNETTDDIDPDVFMDERVDIKTPVIELNNQFDGKLMPEKDVGGSANSEKINIQTGPESAFAANEELIESLENLLVHPPVVEACNEVIMLANEFVDELPIVTEALKASKTEEKVDDRLSYVDTTLQVVESCSSEDMRNEESSSSVCSSRSTSHSTAKYNPMSSSLTDIDALVHDDVANIPETSKQESRTQSSNICETVTGQRGKDAVKAPTSLKELCVDKIAGLEYGNTILKELATVSQSLGEFAKDALLEMRDLDARREEMLSVDVPPEQPKVPAVPVRHHSKLPPALHLEKTPPPVAPRQSSFKVLQEDPPWIGLQSQKDPTVVAYLSPLQKKQIETTKNYSKDEARELIDMHCKYADRRCYDENSNSEKMPAVSNNNDDKMAVQVTGERAAPDTTNRLLAIIRDPAVNPKVQKEKVENDKPQESTFDFMETLKTFEDMNKSLENDHRLRSWVKKEGNVRESCEISDHHTSTKTFKAIVKDNKSDAAVQQPKETIIKINQNIDKPVINGSSERIVKVTLEKQSDAKNNVFEDPKRELQYLQNKRSFLLDDPVFESKVPKHDFGMVKEVRTYRKSSLPKELHDAQMDYILKKEKEIEEQIKRLEEERHLTNVKIESKISNDQCFQAEKYRISRQGDVATYQSDVSKESTSKSNKIERPNLISEGEKFREQMYCEYMDKVAEREERKQHKVIKITNVPNGTNSENNEGDKNTLNEIRNTCNKIEEEFITKARERWDKMGFGDEIKEDAAKGEKEAKVIEHKIKVVADDGEKDVTQLPTHLQEFVEFTSNGDETGESWTDSGMGLSLLFVLCPILLLAVAVVKKFW